MANYYTDNDDLRFYIERAIDWEPLVQLTEYGFRGERGDGPADVAEAVDFYKDIFDLIGGFVADEVAPVGKQDQEPRLVDGEVVYPEAVQGLFEAIKEMDLHGMCVPRELGGMNCPLVVYLLNLEMFARADVSICAHFGFHGGMAMAALAYSAREGSTEVDHDKVLISSTRFGDAISEIISGEAWGSMDLTEPDAGSDLGKIRCRAELGADGVWRVSGNKSFITSGDGKYHFVIARTEASATTDDAFAGLEGLSMFLVSAWSEDADGNRVKRVVVTNLEDKLGHHGSATCGLAFEAAPGELIGARGEGFKQMLLLMNNARVGVGFESLGLAEAAYRAAVDYAAERESMGKTIDRHEMVADMLDEIRTDIQGIRALTVHAAVHEELAQKFDMSARFWGDGAGQDRAELERQARHHKRAARRVTPLVKYMASEKAVQIARRAIQILGGAGYMREYGVEKLLRDAIVFPIYEGTSQIQSLMAMKDALLGAVKRPQAFVRAGAKARLKAASSRSSLERRVAKLQLVQHSTLRFLLTRVAAGKLDALRQHGLSEWSTVLKSWDPKKDFSRAMLHAERLTQILGDVAVAEVLLDQARRFPEREELLVRWLERAEPRVRFNHDRITTTGGRLLASLAHDPHPAQAAAK